MLGQETLHDPDEGSGGPRSPMQDFESTLVYRRIGSGSVHSFRAKDSANSPVAKAADMENPFDSIYGKLQ